MQIVDRIALIILLIGGINWGSIGLFKFDIVAWLFGGPSTLLARIIYALVGVCALWCLTLLFRTREDMVESQHHYSH